MQVQNEGSYIIIFNGVRLQGQSTFQTITDINVCVSAVAYAFVCMYLCILFIYGCIYLFI